MPRIPRPARGIAWALKQAALYDVFIAIFASSIGFVASWNYWSQNHHSMSMLAFAGAVGVLVASVVKHALTLREARLKQSTHELEGCLHTLHEVLVPGNCKLRVAIHVPVGEELEQVTEYIGDRPKAGRVGRRFPANAGIIGKAFRDKEVYVARRTSDDYEAYIRELTTKWNYVEERARKLNPGAMTWMAVPLIDDRNNVDAIVFLDAAERDFFTPARQEIVLAAVRGIALFVGRRYS